jgi:hypothetical protein
LQSRFTFLTRVAAEAYLCFSQVLFDARQCGGNMKVLCSLLLSAVLIFPSPVFAATNRAQDQDAKPAAPAQGPQSNSAATPVVRQPLAFGLQDATPVRMRINRSISSADAQVNETVDFEVLDDVKVKDAIVIPRGGMAWGTVTEAQPKRRMGRTGKLNITIDNVRLASGEKVALRAVKDVQGKDITIPKGTEITAYINGDIPLDPAKFMPATAAK